MVDVTVEDPVTYEDYRKLVDPTLALYGGKFLVRGGKTETIEGDWQPRRFVILEFADAEQFRRWYNSPEYEKAKQIRWKSSSARAVLAEGV